MEAQETAPEPPKAEGAEASTDAKSGEAQGAPLTILYFRQAGRRDDGGEAFGKGLADAVSAVNGRDGGLNNITVDLKECDIPAGAEAATLLGASGCNGAAAEARLAIVWPREDLEAFAIEAERSGFPLIAVAGRDALSQGEELRWSFAPPLSLSRQALALLEAASSTADKKEPVQRIALFHSADAWGGDMRDALMSASERQGFTLQTYSVRAGEAQDIISTFRDFGVSPPDRIIIWGNGGVADTVLREAVKRDYPVGQLVSGFADAAYETLVDLGARGKGFGVVAMTAPASSPSPETDDDASKGKGEGTPPLRATGELVGALSVEALGAAQELANDRYPARGDVRTALERVNLTPERMKALGLAPLPSALKLSCTDHAGSAEPVFLQWSGGVFAQIPLELPAAAGSSARNGSSALTSQIGDERAEAPSCPTDKVEE
ncbi:ABC transporter substrate-binding protein [Notoacmeibacter ruber]|uniref:ABC transporter substrate-binding protein n=1 Tax=Notoacmeibacter ruber TaxID=2670375 RepID=UPI001AECC608|nr:ABC transporter substrate-binding protein [Notoacmeibacter ruber]